MKNGKHIIWSNYNLDYEDWRADLEAEYPDMTEAERIELMYKINSDYFDDERCNLNVQLSRPILLIADIGRWNGRFSGYGEIESGNIRDCLYSELDYATWYVDSLSAVQCPLSRKSQIHRSYGVSEGGCLRRGHYPARRKGSSAAV